MSRLGGPVFGWRVFWGRDSCLDSPPGERVPPPGTGRHGSKGNLSRPETTKIQQRTRGCNHIQSESRAQAQTSDQKVKKSIIIQSSPAQTGGKPDRYAFVCAKALGKHRKPARERRAENQPPGRAEGGGPGCRARERTREISRAGRADRTARRAHRACLLPPMRMRVYRARSGPQSSPQSSTAPPANARGARTRGARDAGHRAGPNRAVRDPSNVPARARLRSRSSRAYMEGGRVTQTCDNAPICMRRAERSPRSSKEGRHGRPGQAC